MKKKIALVVLAAAVSPLLFVFQNFTEPDDVFWGRSLMVRDPALLNQLNDTYDFGVQLGVLNNWLLNEKPGKRDPKKENPGYLVAHMIETAHRQQNEHESMPASKRLGAPIADNRKMDAVFRNWKSAEQLKAIKSPNGLKNGPFRMLAIVNLLDRAGDAVATSTSAATKQPKSLGELHIVYGLVDKQFETKNKQAYPQTFVLAYKLPPLKWQDGALVVDPDLSYKTLMKGDNIWRYKMHLWASLWTQLSNYPVDSAEYKNQLTRILRLATRPENFVSVRSNARVNDTEFELREWYVLGNSQLLIPKKPRDEPYRCLSGSNDLRRLVDYYWDSSYHDLDVTTYDPSKNDNDPDYAGYDLPRDNKTGFFKNQWQFPTCGDRKAALPYGMHSSGDGIVQGERIVLQAPFGRTKGNRIWQLTAAATEPQRHAFAIRTCTGCHSSEGVADGFHIFPRLANERSKISGFLAGGNFGARNTFTHAGHTYNYNILAERKAFLIKAADKSIPLVIGEGLLRPEMSH